MVAPSRSGAIDILGFLKELGDLLLVELHQFDGLAVTHGAVFAGVGDNFGAIDGHGDVADLESAGDYYEDLMEGGEEDVFDFAAELANRVVVGVVWAVENSLRHFRR